MSLCPTKRVHNKRLLQRTQIETRSDIQAGECNPCFFVALWSYGVQLINEEIMVGVFFLAFQTFQRLLSDSSAILLDDDYWPTDEKEEYVPVSLATAPN